MNIRLFCLILTPAILTSLAPVNSQCEFLPETFSLCTTYDTQWDGMRLYLYPRTDANRIQSFYAGEAFCRQYNATLLSIHSIAENEFLDNWMTARKIIFWIGLHRQSSELEWEWTDGSPLDFTNWGKSDNFPLSSGSDCATFDPLQTFNWFNFDFDQCDSYKYRHIICQIKFKSESHISVYLNKTKV
jgi:hypothetical protein